VTERTGHGFNDLGPAERGLVLGLSLLALGDAAVSRLAGDHRDACGRAWQALRTLSRAHRAALLAGWIVETNAPFPPGMERLHPSWLAEAIASQPAELWPVLLSGLPGAQVVQSLLSQSHDAAVIANERDAWPSDGVAELQRLVFNRLARLCMGPCGPLGAGLCRLSCAKLLAEVAGRGTVLRQELCSEGDASLWAVAGRLPVTLGRQWLKW